MRNEAENKKSIKAIDEIGNKLVKCDLHCQGVNNNPKKGIIPRCLNVEKRSGRNTCAVVGLNPGKCKNDERNYYLASGIKYSSIANYFEKKIRNRAYFKRTREIISLLGFDGDILWTDLAKCECSGKNGSAPIQTLRVCINRFLREEIAFFQCATIFALGNEAFKFCALSFPNHFVVSIPHPTGSRGDFSTLKNSVIRNKRYFIRKISDKKDPDGNYKAVNMKFLKR